MRNMKITQKKYEMFEAILLRHMTKDQAKVIRGKLEAMAPQEIEGFFRTVDTFGTNSNLLTPLERQKILLERAAKALVALL